MKVLWFSNRLITKEKVTGTGTWLIAMADILTKSNEVQLFNITLGSHKFTKKTVINGIQQWEIPNFNNKKSRLPGNKNIQEIQKIVQEIKPDIIHIWGTETTWGLLTARRYIKGNVILEIQGLRSQIKKQIFSGLSLPDIFKCFGLKEILKPKVSLIGLMKFLRRSAKFETEIIKKHTVISTQSDWVRAHISLLNPNAKIYNTLRPLRKKFSEDIYWKYDDCKKFSIFTSAASPTPYKGLHILIDAIGLLKNKYPDIELHIAGYTGTGIRESGYVKFLKRKIRKNGITKNVYWIGPISEDKIIIELIKANIAVIPSFIESYGAALAESLAVGTPTVVAYAGALPEHGIDKKSLLFFPPGDIFLCAKNIDKLFSDSELSKKLSLNAIKSRNKITDEKISNLQIRIYNELLTNARSSNF
jgi:glycosyltransferase involved in cell wall biosynthesis